jgi:hypothetical protein
MDYLIAFKISLFFIGGVSRAGLKSTVIFALINATAYHSDPKSAPYVLGLTVVPWLAYIMAVIILPAFGAVAWWMGDQQDPKKAEEFHENFGKPRKR